MNILDTTLKSLELYIKNESPGIYEFSDKIFRHDKKIRKKGSPKYQISSYIVKELDLDSGKLITMDLYSYNEEDSIASICFDPLHDFETLGIKVGNIWHLYGANLDTSKTIKEYLDENR